MNATRANPIYCALDTADQDRARTLANQIASSVGGIKLGLEFVTGQGMKSVNEFVAGPLPVFLDLKFHDIPNTVAGAVREAGELGVEMLTVHAAAGQATLEAAAAAAHSARQPPKVIAVTVLTSLGVGDLKSTGIEATPSAQALRLSLLAQRAGCDGVVCSPREVAVIREATGPNFLLIVPGIRAVGANVDDQKRTATAAEAIALGADLLVVGRPITEAADPRAAAEALNAELNLS